MIYLCLSQNAMLEREAWPRTRQHDSHLQAEVQMMRREASAAAATWRPSSISSRHRPMAAFTRQYLQCDGHSDARPPAASYRTPR